MPLSNHLVARWRRLDLFQQVGGRSFIYCHSYVVKQLDVEYIEF